jgi:HEAT repeat protein
MEKEIRIKELINEIKSNNEDVARAAIFEVGEKKINEVKPLLVELLNSRSPFIRDAAAMSLGDLKANEVVPKIIDLIQQPENENNRGSLIYALQSFDVRDFFLLFTDLIISGNFEVREMAIDLIENSIEKTEPSILLQALKKLNAAKNLYSENQEVNDTSAIKYIDYEIELITNQK